MAPTNRATHPILPTEAGNLRTPPRTHPLALDWHRRCGGRGATERQQNEELAYTSEWRFRSTGPHCLMCSSRPVPILGDPHSRSASNAVSLCLRRSLRNSEMGFLAGNNRPDQLTDRPALQVSAGSGYVGGLVAHELVPEFNQGRAPVGRLDLVLVHMHPIEWPSNPNCVKHGACHGDSEYSQSSKASSAETQSTRFVGGVGRIG